MIAVTCPVCGGQLRVKDEYAGKTGRCPKCGDKVRIPAAHPNLEAAGSSSRQDRQIACAVAEIDEAASESAVSTIRSSAPHQKPLRAKPWWKRRLPNWVELLVWLIVVSPVAVIALLVAFGLIRFLETTVSASTVFFVLLGFIAAAVARISWNTQPKKEGPKATSAKPARIILATSPINLVIDRDGTLVSNQMGQEHPIDIGGNRDLWLKAAVAKWGLVRVVDGAGQLQPLLPTQPFDLAPSKLPDGTPVLMIAPLDGLLANERIPAVERVDAYKG